ncbi:hypothetical protein Bca101_057587 [Brassica carinata]
MALISGLHCHAYPNNYERMGGSGFIEKHFETGKKIKYDTIEKKLKEMKGPCSWERLKMAVLYFLCSVILGPKKTGKDAPSVDRFFLRVVNNLDLCKTFPWGRFACDQNLNDVSCYFSFEAIPVLRNHYIKMVDNTNPDCPRMGKMQYKNVGGTKACSILEMNVRLGTTKDIKSILEATPDEKRVLRRIMGKENDWNVNDNDDAVVDRWTKNILKGKQRIWFEEMYKNDYTAHVSAPSAPARKKTMTPVETPLIETPRVS